MEFKQPPVIYTEQGTIRKVGFELEFGDTELDTVANIIIKLYGGTHVRHSRFNQEVQQTELGCFYLKMDARMLSEKSYESTLNELGLDYDTTAVEEIMESVASIIVPYEIGTPPIPVTEVHKIDALRLELLKNEASGTKASIINRYAMHINAELPALNVQTILNFMRAFLLLYPAIYHHSKIVLARRLSNYIDPYPDDYIMLVLHPDYNPDFDRFLKDYNQHNPDRNRPLDFYPVLAYIDKEKVALLEDIGNVKPRPALHYRLPNSLVDEPEWSFAVDWNFWVAIEELAARPNFMQQLSQEYLALEENTWFGFNNKWIKRTEELLECKNLPDQE